MTAWVIGAAAITFVLLTALDGRDGLEVTLPPVRETKLAEAVRDAGCQLRRAKPAERLNPPVDGPVDSPPAAPGFYDDAPAPPSLVAALRDGVVVIHFRGDLGDAGLDVLRRLQSAVPEGTIVARNETRMPFEVAVTAYRRLLGCPRFGEASIDALQLFRGRFVGSGPDA